MLDYSFHWRTVLLGLPDLLHGAVVTLEVTALTMAIGAPLALMIALCLSRRGVLALPARFVVEIVRNTPSLFQLYLFYFGLGSFGLNLSSFQAAVLAIGLNNAGYLGETYRGILESIPSAQRRAARSLGMSAMQAFVHVVLPQFARIALLPTTNQTMWAMLNSSLAMLIGLKELSGATQVAQSGSFRTLEFFLAAALIYYLIAKVIIVAGNLISSRVAWTGK